MDFNSILALSFVCAMGAISPGPSLSVVLRNTISAGRIEGVMTGIGHGVGLCMYAFIAVMGLSSIVLSNKKIFILLQCTGALVLVFLAFKLILSSGKQKIIKDGYNQGIRRGFAEGFMIAFLNPKILVFFVAIFSQYITSDMKIYDRITMAFIAGVIDTVWYVMVALVLAGTSIIDKVRENSIMVDRLIGLFLLVFGVLLLIELLDVEYFNL